MAPRLFTRMKLLVSVRYITDPELQALTEGVFYESRFSLEKSQSRKEEVRP